MGAQKPSATSAASTRTTARSRRAASQSQRSHGHCCLGRGRSGCAPRGGTKSGYRASGPIRSRIASAPSGRPVKAMPAVLRLTRPCDKCLAYDAALFDFFTQSRSAAGRCDPPNQTGRTPVSRTRGRKRGCHRRARRLQQAQGKRASPAPVHRCPRRIPCRPMRYPPSAFACRLPGVESEHPDLAPKTSQRALETVVGALTEAGD
jgi:hypothetical protein